MKKIVTVLLVVLMLCSLCGCGKKGFDVKDLEPSAFEGVEFSQLVQMYIKQRTVTDETGELAIALENSSDIDYTFDALTVLEVSIDGKWYRVPALSEAITMELYTLPAGSTEQAMFYIAGAYDTLPEGDYRIVKQLVDAEGNIVPVCAQFTIGRA